MQIWSLTVVSGQSDADKVRDHQPAQSSSTVQKQTAHPSSPETSTMPKQEQLEEPQHDLMREPELSFVG
jgi:hypothetical protein